MSLSFGLVAVKGLRKKKKKKKVVGGRRRSILKDDSRSAATFGKILEEVLMEILARLPVNSLKMWKCVSKLWSSLITSRYFTNLFFKLSSLTRERRVFMSVVDKEYHSDYMLFSASPSNWDAASFPLLNQDLTLPGMGGHFVNSGKRCVVMSFNLAYEEFNLIELPVEVGIVWHACRANLMNYRGKVAVFEWSRLITEGMLDLWVVEDAGTSKWSHKVSVLPSHQLMKSLDVSELVIRSTNRSGEIRLSGRIVDRNKMSVNVVYDLEKNRITRGVAIEPL
ncbi:F-box-like domain superfamily [Arabidopsis thaliana x Arabidopsis arenosa]|uniref:F-box-like domain superfamily n=1 Tax=Arabidopsis thaliana x Arabidopsis arenosa TaxID=1240361 RepID=A0A8T2AX01_9BRAS|nr:F-box-like domain superfamily [Arabidopsis thaliana x Arabidopsis arenosa]